MQRYEYWKNTPRTMLAAMVVLAAVALVPIVNLIYLGVTQLKIGVDGSLDVENLGQIGDFFGGHTAAFAGSLSLLTILFFSFHQSKQQEAFFTKQAEDQEQNASRAFFLEGIGLITQWDLANPGADQGLRLLDYYSRLALASKDRELLLILNTVITAQIRANLEGKNGSFKRTNYPFACEALEKIAELRKEDGLALRARRRTSP
jgi:hypothetical protein